MIRRQPSGSEPITARSPLRMRAVLSGIALVAAIAAAVVFALIGGSAGWTVTVICVVVAVIAVIDLLVIWRRSRV